MTKTLSERALLVSLSISQWSARKYDRRESSKLTAAHGADAKAARVNKNLLPAGDALEAVHAKTHEVQRFFYKHTLPWAQEGQRILPSMQYIEFARELGKMMDDWKATVDTFIAKYPSMRNEAQMRLGTLFKAEDYPMAFEVRAKFKIDAVFLPVPQASDWRVDVGDLERERLEKDVTERVQAAVGKAMGDAWGRLHDVISKAHERLAQPDAIFRNSLVENAVELCGLLTKLNLTEDPHLEEIRRDLEGSLCQFQPDTLREDKAVRQDVADEMKAIMDKMSAFYVPAQQAA